MFIDKNSVTVGIVTYASRWSMVEKILTKLNEISEIGTIILIDNNSDYNLYDKLSLLKIDKNVRVIKLNKNYGSAGGFKRAITEVLKIENEAFLLLLDDDTYIEYDALKKLSTDTKYENMNLDQFAYSFFRPSWIKNTEYPISYYENTFFEFSISHKIKKQNEIQDTKNMFSRRPYVPYAGLFMSKKIAVNLDLPIDDYYLYVDDTNFTYGLYQRGYELYAYKGSQLFELEESWAQSKKVVFFEAYFSADANQKMRANYNIRNRVHFEWNNLAKHKIKYLTNQFIYLSFVFMKYMPKNLTGIRDFREILSYINKGKNGKLGKNLY